MGITACEDPSPDAYYGAEGGGALFLENWQNIPAVRFGVLLTRRYLRHRVGIQSAALAFYLLFTVFPVLVFVSALPGLLAVDTAAILRELDAVLPREVLALAEMYLAHVGQRPGLRLLLFGLMLSVWFPMRAANVLMRAARRAYGLGPPRRPVVHTVKTLLYTLLLMLAIGLTLMVLAVSGRLAGEGAKLLGFPPHWGSWWGGLRFPLAAAVGALARFFLYALAQDERRPIRELWPGALAALAVWLMLSRLYSLYVERLAHYSLFYGAVGAVIVLLVWLYLTAAVLVMGAEGNAVLLEMKQGRTA